MDYERCGVRDNRDNLPSDRPTYYQRLREVGYRVGGVGKFDLKKDSATAPALRDWGADGTLGIPEWGFTEGINNEGKLDGSTCYRAAGRPKGPYLEFLAAKGLAETYVAEHAARHAKRDAYVTALPDDAYCDNWIAENALQLLRGFPSETPWHLVVNFAGPHQPMDVTASMHERWEGVRFPSPVNNRDREYAEEDHQRNRRYYAAMIENIDRQLGRLINAVRERGELSNTYIVYASDHGEMLGDHGLWGKSVWRMASVGIPLVIAGPKIEAGTSSDALVLLHDLAATFIDLAGAAPLAEAEALSLRPVLLGDSNRHRPWAYSALKDWRMLFDGRYKLVAQNGQEPSLYDLTTDPEETRDVASRFPEVTAALRERLCSGRA